MSNEFEEALKGLDLSAFFKNEEIKGGSQELASLKQVAGGFAPALSQTEQAELLRLLEEKERRDKYSGLNKWFRYGTEYGIDKLPRHKAFFDAGALYAERMFMAGNRVGKSVSGAFETAVHLTGLYPDWWEGHRWNRPISAWAASKTSEMTRDYPQKELLGDLGQLGMGMIPAELIVGQPTSKPGTPGAYAHFQVKHASGGISICRFKSYEQGQPAFYGAAIDLAWLDEEPPIDVYNETVMRTMTTKGRTMVTQTPLEGITPFITYFDSLAEHLCGAVPVVSQAKDRPPRPTKALIQAGWRHAIWIDEQTREDFKYKFPDPREYQARSEGIPTLGAGNVYRTPLNEILTDPVTIKPHWKRLWAMDPGWRRTAVAWGAYDPDTDKLYIYDLAYLAETRPEQVVEEIRARDRAAGYEIPGVIDPAAKGSSQADGKKLMDIYQREHRLKVRKADNAVVAGINAVGSRLANGNMLFYKHLHDLHKEYTNYHFDDKGEVVKKEDHALDAVRYLVMGLKYAQPKNMPGTYGGDEGYAGFNPFG